MPMPDPSVSLFVAAATHHSAGIPMALVIVVAAVCLSIVFLSGGEE